MPLRTALLLAALGQEGALDVVLVLLREEGEWSVGQIQKAVGLPQPTVTRRLQELATAGLVDHGRRGQPYRLREPGRLSTLLADASRLSEQLLTLDREAEQTFRSRLPSP